MIKFTTLSIKNFLSYGNVPTVIQLDRPGSTLILGEDLDNTESGTGANGVGKAQPLYSKIKTPNGWTTMGEISIGDSVSTPDGNYASVVGVFPQGLRPTYRITFADGRTADADEEHLWSVFSHRWGKQHERGNKLLTTKELKEFVDVSNQKQKAWYNIFVPTITTPSVEDKEVPIDPYLLGALLGDGCLSTPQFRFSSMDSGIINSVNEILERYDSRLTKDSSPADWRINKGILNERIGAMGLQGAKSHTKFIPSMYKEGTSVQQKLDLLAGLMDTNGTVSKTKNVSFCSVSKQLALDVQYLIRSLGGKATISKRAPAYTDTEGNKSQGRVAYNVSIQYKHPAELFRLERKKSRLSNSEMQYAKAGLRVVSVEKISDQECQCIMIDHPDHLYITDNFVVTHNTVLINAIAYAVYGKPISNISLDNLVNNINKKKMEVIVEFEMNNKIYRVRRVRKEKAYAAGNYVQLFIRNVGEELDETEHDKTPDSVGNTNKLLESIIGLPYELFVRIVVFSATHVPFLDLPVRHPTQANQTDIIEELFDLKTLSEKAVALKDEIKLMEGRLETKMIRVDALKKEHARHQKMLEAAENRVVNWAAQNKQDIDAIVAKLEKIESVDIEGQRELHQQLAVIDQTLNNKLIEQRDVERKIKKHGRIRKEKNTELEHLREAKCPYCLQQYAGANAKIAECEEAVEEAEAHIELLSVDLDTIDTQIEQLTKEHKEIKNQIVVQDLDELLDIRSKSAHYQEKLEEMKHAVNPHLESLQDQQSQKLDEIDMEEINELNTTIEHQKFLLKLLTRKDSFVRKALLNKNIPFLNARLQHYLSQLQLPHTVEFTHEMTASISQFGRPMDFGNLSNGQRARVNLALSFAFRDVLQSMHERINVCMLDEVLDVGLDAVGVQNAARMLKRKAREEKLSLYVISHRDEIDSAFDRKMVVQMSKGFSYVLGDDE